ncbi:MAG: hypothetical protein JNK12_24655 [Acidimicrobiales bacterium]|nr:hypothetical protein [Acidimicrobiales bacterium]
MVDIAPPGDIAHLGVPETLILDIVLRRMLRDGQSSTTQLALDVAVTPYVMEQALAELRNQRLIEVLRLDGRNMQVVLTDLGREQAMARVSLCRYTGAVPVSLSDYDCVVRAQQGRPNVHHDTIRASFTDLVINDALLDELGPAIRSKGAMFLYGPPGTGKSSIAERLIRVHGDQVLIPQAVEVDGQIITVFDPVLHKPTVQPDRIDRRWILCERPSVIVGGELTASQLDLTFQSNAGIYLAPLQMQANNGILVIDDFGRQSVSPEQLLNRWIVPLDRGIDYLTLDYGVKFEIPCLTKIVFSTNMEPAHLADEAFFRRIRSKILIPAMDDAQFDEVLVKVAAHTGVMLAPGASERLRQASRQHGDGDVRPYLPAAVCELVVSISEYEGVGPVLDVAMVDRVVTIFFTQDRAMASD